MDRTEFIERLQRALAGGVNSSRVAENVQYYREYIDMEIRKGRSEEEVLGSLGDPRLLAKSIIEANKRAGVSEGTNRTYDEEREESYAEKWRNAMKQNTMRIPRLADFADCDCDFFTDYRSGFFYDLYSCAGYYSCSACLACR